MQKVTASTYHDPYPNKRMCHVPGYAPLFSLHKCRRPWGFDVWVFHWTNRHTLVKIPISIHQGSAELDTVKMKGVGVARKFILPTPRSNNLTARQNEDYAILYSTTPSLSLLGRLYYLDRTAVRGFIILWSDSINYHYYLDLRRQEINCKLYWIIQSKVRLVSNTTSFQ